MGTSGQGLEIPRYLLPTPTTIASYIFVKFQLLASHTLMTLLEAGIGFIVGSLSAIVTAVLFLWFRPLKEMFYPYAVILNSTRSLPSLHRLSSSLGVEWVPKS